MDIRKFFVPKQFSEAENMPVLQSLDQQVGSEVECTDEVPIECIAMTSHDGFPATPTNEYGERIYGAEHILGATTGNAEDDQDNCEIFVEPKSTSLSDSDDEGALLSAIVPNHPSVKCIPVQTIVVQYQNQKKRVLHFQESWFKDFPWLHYSTKLEGVICFPCAKSAALKLVDLSKNAEQAFVTIGFNNWKKALEKFNKHQNNSAHAYSVKQLAHHKASKPIDSQLWQQVKKQQQDSWFCLNKIIHTIALLAKQGLALRGHDDKDGNFRQVLEARADDVPCLKQWITSSRAEYLSPDIQNEVLQLLSHAILHILRNSIGDNPFAVIVDGTQDISGQEQE
ncbi:zinc finger MYM-type protein 1-like [Ambystoma mexicanum]|uniref:zinc finger MYM-type protein 1-like n=1 Tax=Ambystoma mexicanum TaxID=8296 RepID=UPI0037E96273